jgi:N-acyl-D-aspartate/D-glutamate deacylase
MHDIVIRGGTILDGTGADPVTGDLAIDGARIAAVGGKAGPGKREIDANGLLVTPGWVDVHTHYDGQATWDPVANITLFAKEVLPRLRELSPSRVPTAAAAQ